MNVIFIFRFILIYVSMCVCGGGIGGGLKWVSDHLELELQAAESHQI